MSAPVTSSEAETPPDGLPLLVIVPTAGWRALNVREMWAFRDLFRALVVRDIKLRYRQTALGLIWVIGQPLLAAGVLTIVFGHVVKVPSGGMPYFLVSLAGTTGWTFFSGVLLRGSSSIVANGGMLGKVFFPRAMLPLSAVGSAILDMVVGLSVLVIAASAYGYYPGLRVVAAVPAALALALLALGPALLLSAATATYRDVAFILPVVSQLLLYLSPVAYSRSIVPDRLRHAYDLNPLVAPLESLRWAFLGRGVISTTAFVGSCVSILLFGFLGSMVFRRFERRFADVL